MFEKPISLWATTVCDNREGFRRCVLDFAAGYAALRAMFVYASQSPLYVVMAPIHELSQATLCLAGRPLEHVWLAQ